MRTPPIRQAEDTLGPISEIRTATSRKPSASTQSSRRA
jgi:hypothetical protein